MQYDKIEAEIGGGQVEELLAVANDELNLIDNYIGMYYKCLTLFDSHKK